MIRRRGLPGEGLGSGDTAVRPQQEVDRPALPVDGSVELGPLAPNLHIRIGDARGAAWRRFARRTGKPEARAATAGVLAPLGGQ